MYDIVEMPSLSSYLVWLEYTPNISSWSGYDLWICKSMCLNFMSLKNHNTSKTQARY